MKLYSYCFDKVFDGNEFVDIRNVDLHNTKILVWDLKNFFKSLIRNKLTFRIENFLDIQYFDTEVKLNFSGLSQFRKIKTILNIQVQNLNRSLKYIPDSIKNEYLQENYNFISDQCKDINFSLIPNSKFIFYNNRIQYALSKLELKNDIKINYNMFGTFTGRITHEYITTKKNDLKEKFKNDNVYEFDFKCFEIQNLLSTLNIYNVQDPYDIEGYSREEAKKIIIPLVYGKIFDFKNIDNILSLPWIKKIIEYREKLVSDIVTNNYSIINPISGIVLKYKNEDDVRKRCFNNYYQSISSDILKIRLYLLYQKFKSDPNIKILFPIYDSIFIKIKNDEYVDKIVSVLEQDINLNNVIYRNKVRNKRL